MLNKIKRRAALSSHIFLTIFAMVTIFPLYITFIMAFKSNQEILTNVMSLPHAFSIESLIDVWVSKKFSLYFLNSVLVVIPHITIILLLTTMFSYGIVFLKIPFGRVIFSIILIGFMIPIQTIIIPLFYTLNNLKLTNSLFALGIVEVVIYIPFCIFLLRSFMMNIPRSLYEAALIDGATNFQLIADVIIPMSKAALLTIIILQFKNSWNEYLLPLVLLVNEKVHTLPLGFSRLQGGRYTLNYNMIGAGSIIMSIPMIIVFLLFQGKFISGIAGGAVKE
nr:carbohydrate ABC transporter permease [uncultured Sphaerochaeta sp.]